MRLVIYIDPIPQPRPRFNRYSKQVHTPNMVKKYKEEIRRAVVWSIGPDREDELPLYPGKIPLRIDLDFIFKRPKAMMTGSWPDGLMWRPSIPDRDNLDKAVLDSVKGVLWEDDAVVVCGEPRKFFAEKKGRPRIEIWVRPAGDPPVAGVGNASASAHDFLAGRKEGRDEEIPTGREQDLFGGYTGNHKRRGH